ncbi:MAG: TraB/GumN family protein [Hellea sp.]
MFRFITIMFTVWLFGCDSSIISSDINVKVELARERNDGPAIWVLKDNDTTLYLFGTVHLLPSNLSWQKSDMQKAFASSGTIFFEANSEANEKVAANILASSLGMRQDGLRLSDSLDSYQLKLLEAVAHNGNLNIALLDSLRPWLASEYITLAAATNAGLSSDLSADEALKSRARRDKKNVIFLETVEEQILTSANLSKSVQMSLLTETLEKYSSLANDLNDVAQSWALGRTDYLSRELVMAMKYKSSELYNNLIVRRNIKWMDKINQFIEGSGTGFVAVGTSHLLGEDSLIEMLREQGYEVSRYYAFQGPNVIKPINPSIKKLN